MTRSDRRTVLLAFCLSALAGYVDSLGFLTLKGFFVSFMSGNSTRLAVGIASGAWPTAEIAAGLIGLFVSGVVAGGIVSHLARERRPPVLCVVALLLGLAALAASAGHDNWSIGLATLALGAENIVLSRAGEVSIGVTYMTGTLVKMGHGIAKALTGGPRWEWLPYLLLWAALAAGSILGALLFPTLRLQGLWIAAGWCAVLVPVSAITQRPRTGPAR